MKNKVLLIMISLLLLFVPTKVLGAEMKSMSRQFQEEILSAYQNENTGIPDSMVHARYLQEEDGSKPPVLAFSIDYATEYIPSPSNSSSAYNYISVDNLITDNYKGGLQYIIQNGFKETTGYYVDNITYFKNQVSNKVTNAPLEGRKWYVNYWATQVAIWWFQDEMDNSSYISNTFKQACRSDSATDIQKAIYRLVSGALEASNDKALKEIRLTTSEASMYLDADDYKSDYISISNPSNLGDYKVTIIEGGNNYKILDVSGRERNTFAPNEKFVIVARELSVTRVEDITIRVDAVKSVNVGFRYINGSDQKLAAVAPGSYTAYGTLKLHVNWIKPVRDISVAKLDSESNKLIGGAVLELRDTNGDFVCEITTKDNERVTFKDIPYGSYTLKEKTAPAHYYKSSESIGIIITSRTDMVIERNIKNDPLKTIRISKVDSEKNTRIPGAVIDIYDQNKELVKEITTTNSFVDVPDLYYGKYTIVEKTPPIGYNKNEQERVVTIDRSSPIIIEVKISNEPLKSIKVASINSEDNYIFAGARLILRNESGEVIQEFTTTSTRTVIGNLPYGTYTIGEETSPEGYEKLSQPVMFTIDQNTNDELLIDVPHKPVYAVKVYKLDGASMQPIAGAILEIKDSNGNVVSKITSTDDYVLVEGLTKGTYTISEIKPPKGFALSSTSETFEIVSNEVLTINFINSEIEVPITGSTSKLIVGALILGLAGFAFVFFGKTTKKRYN